MTTNPEKNWRWPPTRIARIGFLLGLGMSPAQIAADSFVRSTEARVRAAMLRWGLRHDGRHDGVVCIGLSHNDREAWEAEAIARGVTVSGMLRRVAGILAKDRTLFKNIIDD